MIAVLKHSCDRKTKFWPKQGNTFGLWPGPEGTCPGATTAVGGCCCVVPGKKLPTCYVYHTMSVYKGVAGVLRHNTTLLQHAPINDQIRLLKLEFDRFRKTELRRAERAKQTPKLHYRLHWSGDIFSYDYAIALSAAMTAFPDIEFWGYTRTLSVAPWLAQTTPNLILFMSIDEHNYSAGLSLFLQWEAAGRPDKNQNLRISYMSPTNDFSERYATFARAHGQPATCPFIVRPCPVDTGKLPLDGGCARCRMCVVRRKPFEVIWFES